ncbi:MAG: hypothetical protein CMJ20_04150 [Phycisphaeraceae bacterium]|nr:hypothetical protein [Phycisphaeraceae bacterium]|tara:strand:- start:2860 stop:3663 length:804 start_codon:yes stop_codon:yes gene_type:complete
MSHQNDNLSSQSSPGVTAGTEAVYTKQRQPLPNALTHELANLVDAGLRHIGLILSQLREPEIHDQDTKPIPGALIDKLETVSHAMSQMATLLHQSRQHNILTSCHPRARNRMGDLIKHLVELISPEAQETDIDIQINIPPTVCNLPAGPLYPVIDNVFRNSVAAINNGNAPPEISQQIQVTGLIKNNTLHLQIRDTGPGLNECLITEDGAFQFGQTTKPDGHGVGLVLCRDIVRSLDGTMTIANHTPHGAVVDICIPIARLVLPASE